MEYELKNTFQLVLLLYSQLFFEELFAKNIANSIFYIWMLATDFLCLVEQSFYNH